MQYIQNLYVEKYHLYTNNEYISHQIFFIFFLGSWCSQFIWNSIKYIDGAHLRKVHHFMKVPGFQKSQFYTLDLEKWHTLGKTQIVVASWTMIDAFSTNWIDLAWSGDNFKVPHLPN